MRTQGDNPRKRSAALKVTLTPQLHADLVEMAEAIGQTPSTAASFAIGQWVSNLKRSQAVTENMVKGVVDALGPELAKVLKEMKL